MASVGLRLDDSAIGTAVALRMKAPAVHAHTCVCGAAVEASGHHGLSCVRSVGRQSRHVSANDIIYRALHAAGVPALREPTGLLAQSNLRPNDVSTLPRCRGKLLLWDFTCLDTLAASHVHDTATQAAAAAVTAERFKAGKYAAFSPNNEVVPVAIETQGSWGPSVWDFVCDLGIWIARISGHQSGGGGLH